MLSVGGPYLMGLRIRDLNESTSKQGMQRHKYWQESTRGCDSWAMRFRRLYALYEAMRRLHRMTAQKKLHVQRL